MLDRDTLKALRESNEHVVIHAEWRNFGDGRTEVDSEIVGKRRDARGESYANVVWELPSYLEYGSGLIREHAVLRAYASVSTPRHHELWRTILALLRAGDECKLCWSANGHANELVHKAGLCVDSVQLEVVRSNRKLRFHIDQSTTLPNSARMFTSQGSSPVYGPNPHMLAA